MDGEDPAPLNSGYSARKSGLLMEVYDARIKMGARIEKALSPNRQSPSCRPYEPNDSLNTNLMMHRGTRPNRMKAEQNV